MTGQRSADFVVIGSGIIGSLAARKLAMAGASVLILEAGGRIARDEIVARFRNSPRRSDWISPYPSSPSAPHPIYQPQDNGYLVQAGPEPYPAEYIRQVGGTSWHWAAQAWRNVPADFRGFRNAMSDQQIATLGNYLQQSYGNPDGKISVEQVTGLRANAAPASLIWLARGAVLLGLLLLVAVVLFVRKRAVNGRLLRRKQNP